MMDLRSATTPTSHLELEHEVWAVVAPTTMPHSSLACRVGSGEASPDGFGLYLRDEPGPRPLQSSILLPPRLQHIEAGDVIYSGRLGTRIHVLWKASARHNSILLTEECDNYCLMCSQPPKTKPDDWLFDRAHQIVDRVPGPAPSIGLTGGEPTLKPAKLLSLLRHCLERFPDGQVHLLSNGRRFSDSSFSLSYSEILHPGLMVGIPLYAGEAQLHDFIVQAPGAFDETLRGILNLASLGQRVEIRIVAQKHNAAHLPVLAEYIARNLPFVEQVALMGLEMTGLARANRSEVWIDPFDYRHELAEAAAILRASRIRTLIYNHQLCVTERRVWDLTVRSISDWKNDYTDVCQSCAVKERCGGVFTTSLGKVSAHIAPIRSLEDLS